MLHESFLAYRGFRHLWASLGLVAVCVALYAVDPSPGGRNGGTFVGYALGALAALLMVWLTLFGARKRAYFARYGSLRGWLSAHVYLGTALLLVVPLHSGFQFGENVHTLAYALLVLVVGTGLVGVLLYSTLPRQLSENRAGEKPESMVLRIDELDLESVRAAGALPDAVAQAVEFGALHTEIGGGLLRRLRRRDRDSPTKRAIALLRAHETELAASERANASRLLELLSLKNALLERLQRDFRYRALLELWLLFHVPLSAAALAATGVHVFVVFYYR